MKTARWHLSPRHRPTDGASHLRGATGLRAARAVVPVLALLAASSCGGTRPATVDSGTNGSGGTSGTATGGANGTGTGGGGAGTGGSTTGSGGHGTGGEATGGTAAGTGGHGSGGTTGTGGRGGGAGGINASGGRTGGGGGAGPDAGTGDSGVSGCTYGGHTYAVGASFPAIDGCNTCTCGAGGVVGCTKIGCVDGGAACALETSYGFWDDGGLRPYVDMSRLTAPRTHTVSRDRFMSAPPPTCMRELPCTSGTDVDVAEIQQALAHPDVVAALAMTTKPFYGTDPRPMDGTVFIFQRGDGRGFTVGSGNGVPAGLRALTDLLRTLQMQTLASTDCATLR